MRLASTPVLFLCVIRCLFTFHDAYILLEFELNSLYALHASNKGGTTVGRRGPEACMTANFTSAGVAIGYSDHSKAIAPVTKGVAALVPLNVLD
jgi:hypothetical protein